MTIPDEIIQQIDPAETGRCGCLVPEIEDETDEGHCDASSEDESE
jgi:hypothetical protein